MKRAAQGSRTNIPGGMATHLPEGASLRRYAQETILSIFFKWGYKEVVTPVFEYLDILAAGLSSGLLEKSYKFVDRESGKLMILRPDITPQVSRMAAGILSDEPKPLRLCYYGNVFRYEESHAGREREMFQMGCELVGTSAPEADAEIIAVASEAVRGLGIDDFKIVIGQVGYLCGIVSFLKDSYGQNLLPENEQTLQEAIVKRDVDLLESILDRIGITGKTKKNILQIPTLFGGEEIFDKALQIARNKDSAKAIENLRQICSILRLHQLTDHVLFDLCDIRGIDYYSGLFFEIFSPGMAYPIGRGGRYDTLIGRFGHECPSTGFAIDIESIIMAKEKQGRSFTDSGIHYLIIGDKKDHGLIIEIGRELRGAGCRVIMDTEGQDADASVDYAKKNKIEKVIVIQGEKVKEYSVIDVKTGKKTKVSKEKIIPSHPPLLKKGERKLRSR